MFGDEAWLLIDDYRRLEVWRRAHALVKLAYRATERFPRGERFGLVSQIRRAAASNPVNLAEGAGRASDRDKARFVDYAIGSSTELEYELRLASELGYLDEDRLEALSEELAEIRGMLMGLRSFFRRQSVT